VRPLLNKPDSKPLRMSRMPKQLLSQLKSKEEKMRRGLELQLKRLRDSELKRLLLKLKREDSWLSQMLKKLD
jgi:hypothetical protein